MKLRRKMMAMIRIIGEKSSPPPRAGTKRRIRPRTGSVTWYRKRTMGLYGSALTQEQKERVVVAVLAVADPL